MAVVDRHLLWRLVAVVVCARVRDAYGDISQTDCIAVCKRRLGLRSTTPVGVKMSKIIRLECREARR